MTRIFVFLACLFSVPAAQAGVGVPSQGTITSPVFSYKFASAPGSDQFDISGSFLQASGAPALNLPSDSVVLSFDSGHFSQTLPANSFTCTATTCTYSNSGASGITNFVIKPSAKTFTASVRKIDISATNSAAMGILFFSVGTNVFSFTPNSPPVAKITGQSSAPIGSLLTFDATQSTDFNLNPISFTWSIVSRPLGSAAALSSTTNSTTSMTVDVAGTYAVRVVPNDGIVNGVPALFSVNVTGGTAPPPPAPGPDNGLIVLSSDYNSYLVGQTANLSLHVNVPDGNGARRYVFLATYDDQPITLTTVTNQLDYSFVTPAFTAAGSHTLKVLQYTETTDIANDLNASIANYNSDILAVQKALQFETSPSVISQLQAEVSFDQAQIAIDQQKLIENRTQVAGPAVLSVVAN